VFGWEGGVFVFGGLVFWFLVGFGCFRGYCVDVFVFCDGGVELVWFFFFVGLWRCVCVFLRV